MAITYTINSPLLGKVRFQDHTATAAAALADFLSDKRDIRTFYPTQDDADGMRDMLAEAAGLFGDFVAAVIADADQNGLTDSADEDTKRVRGYMADMIGDIAGFAAQGRRG